MHLNSNMWCLSLIWVDASKMQPGIWNLADEFCTPLCNAVALPHGGSVVYESCTTAPLAWQVWGQSVGEKQAYLRNMDCPSKALPVVRPTVEFTTFINGRTNENKHLSVTDLGDAPLTHRRPLWRQTGLNQKWSTGQKRVSSIFFFFLEEL